MKLITAIAALALLAGSMDVEAQKRGKANNPPGGGKTPGTHQKAPERAETGHPHISPVAHLAVGVFGELGPEERNDLTEAAGEGDEEAFEELRAERVEATEAMLGALDDEDARALIKLGMMLGWDLPAGTEPSLADNAPVKINTDGSTGLKFDGSSTIELEALDERLHMVQEHLEELLEQIKEASYEPKGDL